MPFCSSCGTKLPNGASFCSNCGEKQTESVPSSSSHRCKKCGNPIPADELVIVQGAELHRICAGVNPSLENSPKRILVKNTEICPS